MNARQNGVTVAVCSTHSADQKWLEQQILQASIANLTSCMDSHATVLKETIHSLPDCMVIAHQDPVPKIPGVKLPVIRLGGTEPAGADIHLPTPCEPKAVSNALRKAISLGTCIQTSPADQCIYFASHIMKSFYREALLYADSDINALIIGDTGTGKEMVARLLHQHHSKRKAGPFVSVNCGAIPEGLFEAEFFGYVPGAFTGATRSHTGYFEQANGGSIFLDEVGELPLHQQVKLLRIIEQQAITPLGSRHSIRLDFRLIAATNRNLHTMVRNGGFRSDLYYRLAVAVLNLPDLEARGAHEKRLLFTHFIKTISKKEVATVDPLPEWLLGAIEKKHFKGNIREMMNVAERAFLNYRVNRRWARSQLHPILEPDIERIFTVSSHNHPEKERILDALKKHQWVRNKAAKDLGISRKVLWEKMHKYRLYEHPEHIGKGPRRRAE